MPDMIKKDAGERHSPGVLGEVRGVLASRHALTALRTGSGVLVRRGTDRLCADGIRGLVGRGAVAGFGVYVAVYDSMAHPNALALTIPAAAGAWVLAAWTLAPAAGEPEPEHDYAEPDETSEVRRPAAPEQVLDGTAAWIRGRIGNGRGVHLSFLLLDAHANGVLHDVPDVGQLRDVLEACGIPVRRSVKVAGEVAYGVHIDDLPKPSPTEPTPTSPEAVYHPALPADLPVNYPSTTA